jgi:[acyl-carrier-protein] S-malonyltransferase
MGKSLYETFSEAKAVFEKAGEILGWDIKKRCFEGPEDILKMTHICQPAVLAVSIAALRVFKTSLSCAPSVAYTAGLSLGEYSALVAAEALSFEDALLLVCKRSQYMQQQAQRYPGKMASVLGLDLETVKAIARDCDVQIANLNCPGQIVVSGSIEAVAKLERLAVQKGAKRVIILETSGAFHSSFMKEAATKLKADLEKININTPRISVVSNVDARVANSSEQIKDNLVCQVYCSVLWEDSMRFMLSQGIKTFYEIGPGRVLKGLVRKIDPNVEVYNIEKKEDILSLQ